MVNANGNFEHNDVTSCFHTESVKVILEEMIGKCDTGVDLIKQGCDPIEVQYKLNWGTTIDTETLHRKKAEFTKLFDYISNAENQRYYLCCHKRGGYLKVLKLLDVTYIRQVVDLGEDSWVLVPESVKVTDFVDVLYLADRDSSDIEVKLPVSSATLYGLNFSNEKYRVFKCKDCGCATYEERSIDSYMLRKGLVPRKRCKYCIDRRKSLKRDNVS